MKRRKFLKQTSFASAGLLTASHKAETASKLSYGPIILSTWDHGMAANKQAWKILKSGGHALDAVEKGVMVVEADPNSQSVGYGGLPDRDGKVTLDACIMNQDGDAGSVAYLQNIMHPISIARKVMEDTPHVMMVGQGAEDFAVSQGHNRTNLLTKAAELDWKEWLKTSKYKPIINIENHDTIGAIALDSNSNLSGACTTSGLAYKMGGRVGDSPIIGAGLYLDEEIGVATATGLGEEVIKTVGSFLIVELMRQGASPQEACEEAAMRIIRRHQRPDFQVAYLALDKNGNHGAVSIHEGFQYAITYEDVHELRKAKHLI